MTPIAFFVPGKVVTQGSYRVAKSRQGRAFAVPDNPAGLATWRGNVGRAAAEALAAAGEETLLQGPLDLDLVFILSRPQAHFGARGNLKASSPDVPARIPDWDKLARAIGDALTGALYGDDKQVSDATVGKRFGAIPGVYIRCKPHVGKALPDWMTEVANSVRERAE